MALARCSRPARRMSHSAEQDLRLAPAVVQHIRWHLGEPAKQLVIGGAQSPVAALHLVERNYHGFVPITRPRHPPSRAPSDPSCKLRANQRDIRAARSKRYIAHVLGDG